MERIPGAVEGKLIVSLALVTDPAVALLAPPLNPSGTQSLSQYNA